MYSPTPFLLVALAFAVAIRGGKVADTTLTAAAIPSFKYTTEKGLFVQEDPRINANPPSYVGYPPP